VEADYRVGRGPGIFSIEGIRAGVAICKDMDFPATIRACGRAGVRILFVPAWDFGRDGWLHGRMAVLGGVEEGFTLVRTG
jgi:apolipoprotein N-acyltransferase